MKQPLVGTKQQLATLLGLSTRRINQLVSNGIIPPRTSTGFELAGAVQAYLAFIQRESGGIKAEKLRYAKLKNDLLELKRGQAEGLLVDRAAVNKTAFECYRQTRDAFMNLPARLSGILAAESNQDEVFRMLTLEVRQILTDLVNGALPPDMAQQEKGPS